MAPVGHIGTILVSPCRDREKSKNLDRSPNAKENHARYLEFRDRAILTSILLVRCQGWTMNVNVLNEILCGYPLTSTCFSPYVCWLTSHPDVDLQENDLFSVLANGDHKRLKQLEDLLIRARDLLSLTDREFRRAFGFSNDLLTLDPEKVHDVLAEPVLVVSLSEHGFGNIRKLPRFIKHEGQRLAASDFVGERAGKKYAIELKTIRMENNPKPQPGKPTGNAPIPYWWGDMFRSNIITKIEDKNRKVLTQLINTKKQMACDYTMLALYTRRLGPSTLMSIEDYEQEIADIKARYEKIDHIFFKDYFGQVVVSPPFGT